jgi:type I site-specific restriction-modification system R (restriction) subunit
VFSSASTVLQLLPSAIARINRAFKTSPAGNVRDFDQRVNSSRSSALNSITA